MRSLFAITAALCVGCAGNGDPAPDAGYEPDPGPGASAAVLALQAPACAPFSDPTVFGTLSPMQTEVRELSLINTTISQAIINEIRIDGSTAFSVGPPEGILQASCFYIPPHQHQHVLAGSCKLQLTFRPTTPGPHMATLRVLGDGFETQIPLTGAGVASGAPVLIADVPAVWFPMRSGFLIRNTGTAAIALGDPVVPAPFRFLSWNCPAILTPNGACNVSLAYEPGADVFGCSTALFRTTGPASDLAIPLAAAGPIPKLTVKTSGSGTVTSNPVGITCGPNSTCTGAFYSVPTVTLTATTNVRFNGWNEYGEGTVMCGRSTTCVAPSNGVVAEALFAPVDSMRVSITMAGTGTVRAVWNTGAGPRAVSCTSSCILYLDAPAGMTLTATTGTLIAWSGDCAGTGDCVLGTIVNDRNVTATFQ
jgi:hypothetical protein